MSSGLPEEEVMDFSALKRGGVMRQVEPGRFALRLHVISGDLTSEHLASIADIARHFGRGEVHLTARQGVEIPHVSQHDLARAKAALASAGLELGACGPRVRTVTGCQGSRVCPHGLVETRSVCAAIDSAFAGLELPHKLKFGVSGCPNSCLKPQENDIGVMGVVEPRFDPELCSHCMVCTTVCETGGVIDGDGEPALVLADCNGCGDCIASCPGDALQIARRGYGLYLGGRVGRHPKLGERYPGMIPDVDSLLKVLHALVDLFRSRGRGGERFGRMLDRIDPAEVKQAIEGALRSQESR